MRTGAHAPEGLGAWVTKPVRQKTMRDAILKVLGRDAAPAPADGGPRSSGHGMQRPRLLVAEDNPVNQLVATRILDKLGYSSDVVANGAEAVAALERLPYAAVLMDCLMPEMDGYEATRRIRRSERPGARVPIIALTANAMKGDLEKCLDAGMDDFLSKPVSAKELGLTLGRWIAVAA
jgi:CheY-like chemotaxis protein